MDADSLIAALDPLAFGARAEQLHRFARGSDPAEVDTVRAELSARGPWERGMAVTLAGARQDADALITALSDPSVAVRAAAARQVAGVVRDPGAVVAAGAGLDLATLGVLTRWIARLRRVDLAIPLADSLGARGEWRAVRVLMPVLPTSTWPGLEARLGVHALNHARLAAVDPRYVLARLGALLDEAGAHGDPDRLWRTFGPALPILRQALPDEVVELVRRAPPRRLSPLEPILGPLLRDAPDVVFAVIGADVGGVLRFGDSVRRHLRTVDDVRLGGLGVALAGREPALTALLGALEPARRAGLFAAVRAAAPDRVWSTALIARLPHAARHAEIRRLLAHSAFQALETQRELRAWLPLDEAVAHLAPRGRPTEADATERGTSWMRWVDAVARERRGMDALVQASSALANEQDPVRVAFLAGLARLPVQLVGEAHIPALRALVDAVIDARDTSWEARQHLVRFGQRLLVSDGANPGPRFQLALYVMQRGQASGHLLLPKLHPGLPRGAEHGLFAAVEAWLVAFNDRDRPGTTLGLAEALGERAWGVPRLQQLLGEIALSGRDRSMRERAIGLWLQDPVTRTARVREVLDDDESAVAVHGVWGHLACVRTDWLDPFLQLRPLKGAWTTKKLGWVPSTLGCARWLPRQQRALLAGKLRAAGDRGHAVVTRAHAIRQVGEIPACTVATLAPWVVADDVPLCEAALGALADLDDPAPALAVLLEHLDGDRARVAMYAVPAVARKVTASALEAELRELLQRRLKVTVHKEVVRLLGAYRLPGASALLAAEWARPKVHRDVRIALLHAALARLDEAWAWDLLDRAAAEPERALPIAVIGISALGVPAAQHRRLLGVQLGLAGHPDPEVGRALAAQLGREPQSLAPVDPLAAATTLGRLWIEGEPSTSAAASSALLAVGSLPGAASAVQDAARAMIARAAAEPPVAELPEDLDLRSARRLEGLADALAGRVVTWRARYAPLGAVLLAELFDPRWFAERASLGLALIPGDADPSGLRALIAAAPDVLARAELADLLETSVADPRRAWAVQDVLALDAAIGDPLVRVGLIAGAGERHGWPGELRVRLGALRVDPLAGRSARAVRVA